MDSLDCLALEGSLAFQVPKVPRGTWARKEFLESKETWDRQGHRDWGSKVRGACLGPKAHQENLETLDLTATLDLQAHLGPLDLPVRVRTARWCPHWATLEVTRFPMESLQNHS